MFSIKPFKKETSKSTVGIVVTAVGIGVELFSAILGFVGAKRAEKIKEEDIDAIAEKTADKLAAKMSAEIKQMVEEDEEESSDNVDDGTVSE